MHLFATAIHKCERLTFSIEYLKLASSWRSLINRPFAVQAHDDLYNATVASAQHQDRRMVLLLAPDGQIALGKWRTCSPVSTLDRWTKVHIIISGSRSDQIRADWQWTSNNLFAGRCVHSMLDYGGQNRGLYVWETGGRWGYREAQLIYIELLT